MITPFKDKNNKTIKLGDELKIQSKHKETARIGKVIKRNALNDKSSFSILFRNGKHGSISTYVDAIMSKDDEPHNWIEII